jgi:hypothetical protein
MQEDVQERDWVAEGHRSEGIKRALARLVIAQGGEVVLDPPYSQSGLEIQRVVAKDKHGDKLAEFTAFLGGAGDATYRLALFTTERSARFDDRSFKFKWWDCFPETYQGLLDYTHAFINKPTEEEKPRRRR